MQNLIKIFNVLAKYHTHEGVYFTGPTPDEIEPEDLQIMLDCGVEWLADQKMWKQTVSLPEIFLSQLEQQSEFIRTTIEELKDQFD